VHENTLRKGRVEALSSVSRRKYGRSFAQGSRERLGCTNERRAKQFGTIDSGRSKMAILTKRDRTITRIGRGFPNPRYWMQDIEIARCNKTRCERHSGLGKCICRWEREPQGATCWILEDPHIKSEGLRRKDVLWSFSSQRRRGGWMVEQYQNWKVASSTE